MIDNNKEYITCSAIWYKDLSLKEVHFPSSHLRPVNIKVGIVFCGHRHLQCLYQMIAMTGLKQHQAGDEVQGFLTSENKFVGRNEARKIAYDAGQVQKEIGPLYSEDIY